jgi:tetratricopeptide (TPR) repeat protein
MNTIGKFSGLAIIAIIVNTGINAQTKTDAINAFNQAVVIMKAEPVSAIESFESCIKISDQVGDSAKDIKEKAVKVLPDLYYQKAYKIYSVDKKIQESLEVCKKGVKVAEKYNNAGSKEKFQKLMVQEYVGLGANYFKNNENEKALSEFDSALSINANSTKALLNKALTYKKMGNTSKFTETIDFYIEKLKSDGDTSQLKQANKIALDYFRISGAKANQANKLADAITLLNSSFKYGIDKDVYFHLADVYNKQKNFTEAAINAQKGIEKDSASTPEAKAKFYYELAVAQSGKGETDDACSSFKFALYGQFLEPSKAQMTNLKCK